MYCGPSLQVAWLVLYSNDYAALLIWTQMFFNGQSFCHKSCPSRTLDLRSSTREMGKLHQYIEMFEYQLIIGHFSDLLLVVGLDISLTII